LIGPAVALEILWPALLAYDGFELVPEPRGGLARLWTYNAPSPTEPERSVTLTPPRGERYVRIQAHSNDLFLTSNFRPKFHETHMSLENRGRTIIIRIRIPPATSAIVLTPSYFD
jgi:hypothetical protein